MSLSKIGKITNALKGASTAEGVANLAATLKSTGDVTTSATILGKYFTQSQLSPEIRKQAMLQAYGEAEVTEDILKAAGAGTTAKTAGTFAFGASNLIDSLKNAGKGLLTVIKPILPILGVVAAIGAGKMIWNWADDKFTLTKETADKKSDEAHKTYTDNKTELDSLQSQYDSNQDRIYELRAKQNKSANEAAELKQLQAENNMLGTQVNIQDRLTKASKYTDAKAAKTALEKKSQQKNYDANLLTENGNQYVDDIDEAADMISYLNKLKEDYQSNLEEYEKYHYDPNKKNDIAMWGKNQTKKREVALKQSEQDLNTFQGELSEKVSKISEDSQRMLDENGNPVDSSFNDVLGRVDNLLTSYYNATNSSSYFEEKLNNIFAKHDFKNIKDDLLKKGKSGGSDAIKDSIKDNQDFVDTLTKYGISIDDLAKEIMSEINPDSFKSWMGETS